MKILTDHIRDTLDAAEAAIKADPPELPVFDPMLTDSGVHATKEYTILQEVVDIEFYADVEYNHGFYAFLPMGLPVSTELDDGETFGGLGGFRIYISGE